MSKLKETISYILIHFPHKDRLSNAWLTKMVYLADWKQAIENQRQITDIKWYFDNYGPFVCDVEKEVCQHPKLFKRQSTMNMHGSPKVLFSIKENGYQPDLSEDEKASIGHIIKVTKDLNWNAFINLVYSTHPIFSSSRYSSLNLIDKAKEYNGGK